MENPPEKYVIAWGNPADGFEYIGTFDSADEAAEYANDSRMDYWWIILLQEPCT